MFRDLDGINIETAIDNADKWFFAKYSKKYAKTGTDREFFKWMQNEHGLHIEFDVSGRPFAPTFFLCEYKDLEKLTMFKLEFT